MGLSSFGAVATVVMPRLGRNRGLLMPAYRYVIDEAEFIGSVESRAYLQVVL